MEILVSVLLGLGLSAACGFRVFVPLLVTALSARADLLQLQGEFDWVASWPTVLALAAATVLEIGGYYLPWVDNLLDTVATPAAVVAGAMVSASVMTGMDPGLTWGLAAIAGGGLAGVFQLATSLLRALSTATTGGTGNFVVSTAEAGSAVTLSLIAVVAPAVAFGLVVALMVIVSRRIGSWRRRRRERRPASAA